MPKQPGTPQQPKLDPKARRAEFVAYDVLEGPFVRFFYRFFPRLERSRYNPNPYGPGIGHIHRLALMLDTAEPLELAYFAAAPFLFVFVALWERIPYLRALGGYGLAFLGVYSGLFFVMLVFLDRRLDQTEWLRAKAYLAGRRDLRDDRLSKRRDAAKLRAEVKGAAEPALTRGQMKARELGADPEATAREQEVPVQPAAPRSALDQLLDPQ